MKLLKIILGRGRNAFRPMCVWMHFAKDICTLCEGGKPLCLCVLACVSPLSFSERTNEAVFSPSSSLLYYRDLRPGSRLLRERGKREGDPPHFFTLRRRRRRCRKMKSEIGVFCDGGKARERKTDRGWKIKGGKVASSRRKLFLLRR